MLNWFHKTKKSLKKEGGLQEKLDSINQKNIVADRILNERRVRDVKIDVDRRHLSPHASTM